MQKADDEDGKGEGSDQSKDSDNSDEDDGIGPSKRALRDVEKAKKRADEELRKELEYRLEDDSEAMAINPYGSETPSSTSDESSATSDTAEEIMTTDSEYVPGPDGLKKRITMR